MGENPPMNPKQNKFGTSVSFDLEESPAPKRFEKKQPEQNLEVAVEDVKPSSAEVECPGCGHGLFRKMNGLKHWLVSFQE